MPLQAVNPATVVSRKQKAWLKATALSTREGIYAFSQFLDFKLQLGPAFSSSSEATEISKLHRIEAALKIISAKAAEIATLAGASTSDIEVVPGGYLVHYQGCDIYYSPATGAHEVHGDIKAKYDALLGAFGKLGLPTTDESSPIGDNTGRFNDFVNGSIYWTAHTGPMMMMIPIRDFWLNNGAQSTFGYPVYDQYKEAVNLFPPTDPGFMVRI